MKLYLSGPMSNLPELNFPAFNAAASNLRALGFEVVNPAELDKEDKAPMTWAQYMRRDIVALMACDGVALLPGWAASRGAMLEIHNATTLKMPVQTVPEWVRDAARFFVLSEASA